MTDPLEQRIIDVVEDALRHTGARQQIRITAEDSMETVPAWDSLSFMSVFTAINEAFGVSPDFDDAIYYTSIKKLCEYLKKRDA